jgi:hypothetical protein
MGVLAEPESAELALASVRRRSLLLFNPMFLWVYFSVLVFFARRHPL